MKNEMTPVELHDGVYVKRDDKFTIGNVCGGKVRTCMHLATGATGLITAGSRHSPQVLIVATLGNLLGVPVRVHTPTGEDTTELTTARNLGAEVIKHRPGYNSVIIKRAKDDALQHPEYTYIPFGMECEEAIVQTMRQVECLQGLPINKIVVPVGSGMSLAGILLGMIVYNIKVPVVGVIVGADPVKRLKVWAPEKWRDMVYLVNSKYKYEDRVVAKIGNIELDPVYEAKCKQYCNSGDLLWIVGKR